MHVSQRILPCRFYIGFILVSHYELNFLMYRFWVHTIWNIFGKINHFSFSSVNFCRVYYPISWLKFPKICPFVTSKHVTWWSCTLVMDQFFQFLEAKNSSHCFFKTFNQLRWTSSVIGIIYFIWNRKSWILHAKNDRGFQIKAYFTVIRFFAQINVKT